MRKRILIGLLLVAITAVAIAFFAMRHESSIDYHRRKIREAQRWMDGTNVTAMDVAKHLWNRARGRGQWYYDEVREHVHALTKLGYLEERAFVVSNRPASKVAREVWLSNYQHFELLQVRRGPGTNTIRIVAPKGDMPALEKLVRGADAPESGE